MDIIAKSRFVRISPKKARLLAGPTSKMRPQAALSALKFSHKSAALPLFKLITSAIANAKNNFGLAESDLRFKSIEVGPGPISKRYRAAARGRVHPIHKRTAHITVILQGEQLKRATDLEQKIGKSLSKPKQAAQVAAAKIKRLTNVNKEEKLDNDKKLNPQIVTDSAKKGKSNLDGT